MTIKVVRGNPTPEELAAGTGGGPRARRGGVRRAVRRARSPRLLVRPGPHRRPSPAPAGADSLVADVLAGGLEPVRRIESEVAGDVKLG
ncbi:hypothetical protein SHIRM173S_01995 [Streptomyces hirsutus]